VTARPSYSRIRTALTALMQHPAVELQLVLAGSALLQRYGGIEETIKNDGFKVAARAHFMVEGETPLTSAKSTGLGLLELSSVLAELSPDIVVTVADRFETIATALAAVNMNIPLAHVQGGEVTGNIDEKIRHAITKLADYHFASNTLASDRITKMGEDPDFVFVTGCPSIDIAKSVIENKQFKLNRFESYGGVGPPIDTDKPYLVVLQHPVTSSFEYASIHIGETLKAVSEIGLPTVWFWPNIDAGSDGTSKGIRKFREINLSAPIHFLRGVGPEDFVLLIRGCAVLVGNSSAGIREASYLGVPAVNIGDRQLGRLRGPNVIDTDYRADQISSAIKAQIGTAPPEPVQIYGDGSAGEKIAQILATVELKNTKRLTY